MKPPSRRASRSVSRATGAAPQTDYSILLVANEDAARHGQPLLTVPGLAFVRQLLLTATQHAKPAEGAEASPTPLNGRKVLPSWDGRRLWLGARLLKEYRQPAPAQTPLLDAFQRQGWSMTCIFDPLPREEGESEEDTQDRLHNAVKNLKRSMPPGTIRFRGDGTGKGVRWEYC